MPAAFEILETSMDNSPKGTFAPRADQTRFRSAFACVAGQKKAGWWDEHTVSNGIFTKDGRARLRFSEFKDEKNKVNTIFHDGMTLREFTCPLEDALEKEKYEGALSDGTVAAYLAARNSDTGGGTQVGRSSDGQQANLSVSVPAAA